MFTMGAAWQMWLFLVLIKLVRSELQGQLLDDFLTFRRISNGFIQGRKSISPAGSEGYVFLGIPYTTPPTGSSRFKKTQPPNNWDGELDATKFGKGCLWNTSLSTQTPNVDIISEDCLSINVYSSKHCLVKGNCSVLVYLHGGRLVSGSSSTLKEELIIENFANDDRNVVFVSMNYRLGMMAMLNLNYKLNLSTASNLNLFDTIEGLKWVQKEIEKFGGNKSQVTLSGHSAGAIITGNVLMSQRSKGLISQAMMFSNSRKDMIMRDANQNYSRTFANLAGCSFYDTDWEDKDQVEEVIACLRRLKGIDFIHYQRKVDEYGFRMLPLTQDYGPDAFYQKDVSHFDLRKLNIPIMMGTTTHELMDGGSCIDKDKNGELSINWGKLETLCRYALASLQFKDRILAVAACVDEYGFDINRVIYSEDDANLYMPLLREIQETNALGNKTFLYQFEYPDVVEILANPKNPTNDPSDYRHQHPMHSDDMAYIIGLKSKEFTPKHKYVQKVYSQMMVNFVKYSNPSDADIKFDEFDPKLNNYFVFDFHPNMTLKGMTNKYRKEAATFWQNTLIEKAGNYTVNYYESTLIETLNSANTLFDGINYPKVSYPPEFYRIETLVTSKKPSTSFIYIIYFIMMVIGAVLAVKCLTCCYKKFQHTKYEKLIV